MALGLNAKRISDAFVEARKGARSLAKFPGTLPVSLADAYAIQDSSIAAWPDQIAGWKIGMIPAEFRQSMGAERIVGPIFSRLVHQAQPGSEIAMPVFEDGFAAVEAEFIFRLGRDVPADVPIDRALALAVAGQLFVGVEVASSPFPGINQLGPICVVSDFGNNHGLILGPEITGWQSLAWPDLPAEVEIDGHTVGTASAADLPGGPIGALEFIMHLMRDRAIALKAGQYISTGAVTGVHEARIGSHSRVGFGAFGSINLHLTHALPQAGIAV